MLHYTIAFAGGAAALGKANNDMNNNDIMNNNDMNNNDMNNNDMNNNDMNIVIIRVLWAAAAALGKDHVNY
jgi:hypothetical protein